ncbi:calmodulin-binding protein 60 B-like isoform X2 [Argentina anserina]|uniref:calmodulin-binding protein 60 B-like isoform X2 n=1 Tax=Argentina anserina TaxID=57926 RepID=UPI0021767BA5|nr:calmodulin-binding protein 60 B-like isoform X2 [Potentilla anserina]
MVPKRHFSDLGGEEFQFPVPESKRRSLFKNVARDVMRDGALNEKAWENFFRTVVRDELEILLIPHLRGSSTSRPPLQLGSSSGARGLQLHFINKLPSTIFTGSRAETEEGKPLQIVLRDAATQNVISLGPLSSVKIEVLVLNSEFGADDQEDWTEREFTNGLVRQREGKRPLVTGEVTLNLKEGVCSLNDIVFTDNSSWIRSRKFRLAARVIAKGPGEEVRIREAISEAFQVKDHRGELYKKHHPPCLNDEIWRLEKIAKDGAFHKRLSERGISNVKDLLQAYVKDQSWLRSCFGSIPNKMWDTIMEHALTCVIDEQKLYAYQRPNATLLFDSIYKLVGAIIEEQFCPLDQLTPSQKVMVENLKLQAYRNEANMLLMDASAVFSLARPVPSLQPEPFNTISNSELPQYSVQFSQQDEQPMQLSFHHASPSSSYPYQAEGSNQLMVSLAQTSQPMQAFNPALRNSFSMLEEFNSLQFNAENSWPHVVQTAHLGTTENLFPLQTATWSPMNPNWGGQENGFCFGSTSENGISGFVKKPKACWCKLRAAIKWWVSVRGRRMARPLYLAS